MPHTCDVSKPARLFRLKATSGCRGPNVSSRMMRARLKSGSASSYLPLFLRKNVMVKIRIRAGHVANHGPCGQPRRLIPPTTRRLKRQFHKACKWSSQITPVRSQEWAQNESFHSHIDTWLTGHVLRSAPTPLAYEIPNGESRISINATLPVLSANPQGHSDLKPHLDVEGLMFPHG